MLKEHYPLSIPGHSGAGAKKISVRGPYDGEAIATLDLADRDAAFTALNGARELFADRKNHLPVYERAAILRRLSALIEKHAEDLAVLIAREGGKPLADAKIEVTRAANTVLLCAEEAVRSHGEEIPMGGSAAGFGRLAFTTPEPVGVVLAISAFNHPVNLIAHQVGPAVAAGCPVLIKPALETALSCLAFMELLKDAGLPEGWATAIPCENDVAGELVKNDGIAFLNFIGSARVGWMLRSQVAPGVRCALEHGGAAPAIFDDGADIDRFLPLLMKGGYYHAGQVCVSVQRIFVHQNMHEALRAKLIAAAEVLRTGDPTDAKTEVGPLIRAGEAARVHGMVEDATAKGADLLIGGKTLDNQCYAPTVLDNVGDECRVMKEEIFGPVLAVTPFTTLDEAIDRANAVPWSFQASIMTPSVDAALRAAKNLDAAAVMVNDHTAFRVDWMPFAGHKQSGLSTGGVRYAIDDMMRKKLVVLRGPS